MMRLFTMPTNRYCLKYATSYVDELKFVEETYNESFVYLVMGSGSEEIDKINERDFFEWNSQESYNIHYVNIDRQRKWLKDVIFKSMVDDKEKMFLIFQPPKNKICYGDVLNRSFLAAVSMEAKTLHRRDSDTKLLDKNNHYPLEMEVRYLGKEYVDFPELGFNSDAKINFVGGNYSGESSGDFLELYKINPELLYRHVGMNYPNKSRDEVLELTHSRFIEINNNLPRDEVEVKLVMERMIELGNCAYFDVYNYLPVSPAFEIMATDYFIHDVLFKLKLPNVYHRYRVLHEHTSERNSTEWFVSYQLRSARYKVFSGIMNEAFKRFGSTTMDIKLSAKNFASCLDNAINNFDYKAMGQFKLDTLKGIFYDSGLSNFIKVARILDEQSLGIIEDVAGEIKKHIFLLNNWNLLVESAKLHNITNYL